ncbi:hypothetical protein GR160_02835 [Flavobacterium sp. Sd200]|uniref:hypothetical protein n=1 Tax=Flavobacterium sp. Sd200 TaxID=2692211 RepID=UPI00136B0FAE|nr:hypothetical protein [Flavobacterium sp. Sd200]MXN90149.1 hypothetical protein [Flavobacterium sp. Sd200]
MKKLLIFLVLLAGMCCNAQAIYTTYDCTTFDEVTGSIVEPFSGCYTTVKRTVTMVKPKFNTTSNTWYESATPEEIAASIPPTQNVDVEHLNEEYPTAPVNFTLIYTKTSETEWKVTQLQPISN